MWLFLWKSSRSMYEVLESTVIHGRPFKEIIMDDDTEIVGQDYRKNQGKKKREGRNCPGPDEH